MRSFVRLRAGVLFSLTILLLLALTAVPARSAVWYLSPTGNDGTGDGSAGNPWQSISHTYSQSSSGDTIHFLPGFYTSGQQITFMGNSASERKKIDWVGEGGTVSVLVANDSGSTFFYYAIADTVYEHRFLDLGFFSGNAGIMTINGWGSLSIERCRFEAQNGYGVRIGNFNDTGDVLLDQCEFVRCVSQGIYMTANCSAVISNCRFSSCGNGISTSGGLYVASNAPTCTVTTSVFTNNNPQGAYISGGPTSLSGCSFDSNVEAGLHVAESFQSVSVMESVFSNNRTHGLWVHYSVGENVFHNNLMVGNDSAGIRADDDCRMENNTIVANGVGVIIAGNNNKASVMNNIIAGNTGYGLHTSLTNQTGFVGYNLFFNDTNFIERTGAFNSPETRNTALQINDSPALALGNRVGAVDFVNETGDSTGDYHLASISIGIDAGDPDTPVGLEPSPNGGRINAGRYGGTSGAASSSRALLNARPQVAFGDTPLPLVNGERICASLAVYDPDGDPNIGLLIEYSTTGAFHGEQGKATIVAGSVDAEEGTPLLNNSAGHQIGNISTASGTNTVSFVWDLSADLPGLPNNELYLRATAFDQIDSSISGYSREFGDGLLVVATAPGAGVDYTSIQSAINASMNGGTVSIQAGTYNEQLTLSRGVHLSGADSRTTVVNAGGAGRPLQTASNASGSYVVENLSFINSNDNGMFASSSESPTVRFSNCRAYDNDDRGMYLGGSVQGFIENCDIFENGLDNEISQSALMLFTSQRVVVRNTTIYNNGNSSASFNYGVSVTNAGESTIFENCLITENRGGSGSGSGVSVGATDTIVFKNCLFLANEGCAISFLDPVQIINCTIHKNYNGIYVSDGAGALIMNNVITANKNAGVLKTPSGMFGWDTSVVPQTSLISNYFANRYASGAGVIAPVQTMLGNNHTDTQINAVYTATDAGTSYGNISSSLGDGLDSPVVNTYINDTGDSSGDYHLRPACMGVNGGNPFSDYGLEPVPNGSRINTGRYGNTTSATSGTAPVANPPAVQIDTQPVQQTDTAAVTVSVGSADGDSLRIALDYSITGAFAGEEAVATLDAASAVKGSVSLNNSAPYAVYAIDSSGTNTVTIVWDIFADTPLLNSDSVFLRVRVTDDESVDSRVSKAFVGDLIPPTTPGALTFYAKTTQSITFQLGAASSDSHFFRYYLFYGDETSVTTMDTQYPGAETTLNSRTYNGETLLTVAGLDTEAQYAFMLMAQDTVGNRSFSAKTIVATAAPSGQWPLFLTAENRPDTAWGGVVVYLIKQDGSSTQTVTVALGESAAFFETGAAGVYRVEVHDTHALTRVFAPVTLGAGGIPDTMPLAIEILLGDSNQDGVINDYDASIVSSGYGQAVPPADPRSDVTNDGVVNLYDLLAVGNNFSLRGETP